MENKFDIDYSGFEPYLARHPAKEPVATTIAMAREMVAEMIVALREGKTVILINEGVRALPLMDEVIEGAEKEKVWTATRGTHFNKTVWGKINRGKAAGIWSGMKVSEIEMLELDAKTRIANKGALICSVNAKTKPEVQKALDACERVTGGALFELERLFVIESFASRYRESGGDLAIALGEEGEADGLEITKELVSRIETNRLKIREAETAGSGIE